MRAARLPPLLLLLAAAAPPQEPDRAQSGSRDGTAPPAARADDGRAPAVDLSVVYTAETWRVARGGRRGGGRYLDSLDVALTVDAERVAGWRGVTLFAYGLYNNGASLSGDLVGDAQIVSNIETGVRAARLYEAWGEKRWTGGSLRAGLYDLASEFDRTEAGALFIQSSQGVGADLGQSGRNGPSIFPVTSLAVRAEAALGGGWAARGAVLDGVPGDPDRPRRTRVRLSRGEGALLVGELAWTDARTKVALGGWAYTARFPELGTGPTGAVGARADNRGAYLLLERRIAPSGARDGAGWAAFARVGGANGRVNPIVRYAGAGVVRTGLLRRGRDDQLGLAVARATFGRSYRRAVRGAGGVPSSHETVVELTYRTPLTGWLTLQPDAQLVIDPSGDRRLRDALVLGVRAELGF
ncbi:carbohydrate porin [Sphingomonas lenta]|uniref:carbohydrate porin n=1 Tax=Sphingomonas lenta TaxID=1141887 RepID=UPI001595AC2F|nr:carbohydrate porin [Sphingomonas lenta]